LVAVVVERERELTQTKLVAMVLPVAFMFGNLIPEIFSV
jgi:hypothetical protein